MFSKEERSCIGDEMDEAAYQRVLDQPLVTFISVLGRLDMILNCLAPENAAELAIVGIGAVTGGIADESAACLRTLYTTTGVSNIPLGPNEDLQDALLYVRFLLCLTDEEAQTFSQFMATPMEVPPSALRCVDEQIDLEQFLSAMTGDLSQLPPQVMQVLERCNINLTPG